MGVYSTAQFLGAFIGGTLGGLMFSQFGISGVFYTGAALTIIWLFVVLPMTPPKHLTTRIIHIDDLSTKSV